MIEVTLALAILLGAGFLCAKAAQRLRLPSVTGYILAGLFLGPSGLALFTPAALGNRLDHFTQIALMLIAFGVGEHLEIRRLRKTLKTAGVIGFFEAACSCILVSGGLWLTSLLLGVGPQGWRVWDYAGVGFLLGAVAIATAPASTLHVIRECKALGSLSSTLLQVIALDNALAIVAFGMAVSFVHNVSGIADVTFGGALLGAFFEIGISLLLGIVTGLLIDLVVHRLEVRGEILTIGLAILLLCGELARAGGFSPLLAGMAAGFTLVNRDRRDVRFFRALNAFETPVYVLFFTLAGAHLNLASLALAGVLGLLYFGLRAAGKFVGVWLAMQTPWGRPCGEPRLGLAMLSQAELAIGLLFLVKSETTLSAYTTLITPVILAGVLLAELFGPVNTRRFFEGVMARKKASDADAWGPAEAEAGSTTPKVQLVPWTWEQLVPPSSAHGVVLFGASHPATVAAIARITTIIAHHHQAAPCAVRVITPELGRYYETIKADATGLFAVEKAEAASLGYELRTEIVRAESVSRGLLSVAAKAGARAIVLGAPIDETSQAFQEVIEAVADEAPCEVVVVRFAGVLHTESILVPLVSHEELATLRNVLCALARVGQHRITLFQLLPGEASRGELLAAEERLAVWVRESIPEAGARWRVVATENRQAAIVQEAGRHDLLIMAATQTTGIQRFFFGSLAESVAMRCQRPMLMVHGPKATANGKAPMG